MSMSTSDLVASLKALLKDAAAKFTDPDDFERQLQIAADDLQRRRPLFQRGSVTVSATVAEYDAPAGLWRLGRLLWGDAARGTPHWHDDYPGRLPSLSLVGGKIRFTPAPTAQQVRVLGTKAEFLYTVRHTLSETAADTTVPEEQREALIVRAGEQALRELAHNGVTKPVNLGSSGKGVGSMPKNGHPAVMADRLHEIFLEMTT